MKSRILAFIAIVAMSGFGSANAEAAELKFEGEFKCQIKHIQIYEINDGVHQSYSGIKDGLDIGDMFTLSYSIIVGTNGDKSTVKVSLNSTEILHYNNVEIEAVGRGFDGVLTLRGSGSSGSGGSLLKLNADRFSSRYTTSIFRMVRYLKNDWAGFIFLDTGLPLRTHQYMVDCRHSKDAVDMALEELTKTDLYFE